MRDVIDGLQLGGQIAPGVRLVQGLLDEAGDSAGSEDTLGCLAGLVELVQILRKG